MEKNKRVFFICSIILLILLLLTGCNNQNSEQNNKTKISEELEYLDSQIINIANKLNNINLENYIITSKEVTLGQESSSKSTGGENSNKESSASEGENGGENKQNESSDKSGTQGETKKNSVTTTEMKPDSILESDENDIDWKSIKSDIEILSEAWSTIVIDLSSINIDNNDILEFSTIIDNCILTIKDENKIDSLNNVAKLYSIIPKFEKNISGPESIQNLKQVKSYILNAYSLVEQENWIDIENNISEADKIYKNIVNDLEYVKDKEYKVNRAYVLIKELQNSLGYEDKKLFYVKYKSLMENINSIN